LKNIMARTDRNTGACTIHRDELLVLFEFAVGGMPTTPNKFTSLLKHHRLHITKVWLDGKTVNGIKAMFQDVDQWTEYGREVNPNAAPVAKPKKLKAVA
jgi:hypothetical protein